MIIEYEVECFDRTLVIKCDNSYAEHVRKIKYILDKAYYDWHSPEKIEDPEERDWVENDACCEEYMMSKVQEIYPALDEASWDTFYYGDDEDEIAEDMKNHQYGYKANISQLNGMINTLEKRNDEFETFEKFGGGHSSIKEELTNRKIHAAEREQIGILRSQNGEIMLIGDCRRSSFAKISRKNQKILQIRVEKSEK